MEIRLNTIWLAILWKVISFIFNLDILNLVLVVSKLETLNVETCDDFLCFVGTFKKSLSITQVFSLCLTVLN